MKDELWSALSDGGELQWIKDLQLIYVISLAYHYIRRVIHIEKMYQEFTRPPSYTTGPADQRIKWLIEIDSTVLQSIEQALEEIEKDVGERG